MKQTKKYRAKQKYVCLLSSDRPCFFAADPKVFLSFYYPHIIF